MFPPVHFASGISPSSLGGAARRLLLVCGFLVCFAAPLRAQDAPPGTVGRVEGKDISVEGGAAASSGTATRAPSIFVSNGSVITVHSGQARLILSAGGGADICGPAKFTLLESGGAITLALNFGRLHVQLPVTTALRVFTPTIVATPIEIGGARRDVTLGLDLTDSICVRADVGALRLEQQFSGEVLDVPQLGEFFLAAGKLNPVAGTPGTCTCEFVQARAAPPPATPEFVVDAKALEPARPKPKTDRPQQAAATPASEPPPVIVVGTLPKSSEAQPAPPPPAPEPAPQPEPQPEPAVTVGAIASANEAHPVAEPPKNEAVDAPSVSAPENNIIIPALSYSANSPEPPPNPTPDVIMLVHVARAEPQWRFTGHVEAPRLQEVAQRTPPPADPQPAGTGKSERKKGGFWARLKRAFVGG
jgi:hypothetical protein